MSVGVTGFPISGPLRGRPNLDTFSMATLGYAQDVPNRAKRRARTAQAQAAITEGEASLLAERRTVRVMITGSPKMLKAMSEPTPRGAAKQDYGRDGQPSS